MKFTEIKFLTACSLAALCVAGQALAHTGVRDKVVASATANAVSYNGFTVTHGCGGDTGDAYPVLGQAAVFPTGDRVTWRDSAGVVIHRGVDAGIFDTRLRNPDGSLTLDPLTQQPLADPGLNLAVTGYASFASAFATVQEIVDSTALTPGIVEGLLWKDGGMEPKLNTITPFRLTLPKLIDSTIKQVNVRIAVVNFCDMEKNAANDAAGPYKAPKDAFGRSIPRLTTFLAPDQINVAGAPVYITLPAGNGDNNRADWWFTALDGVSTRWNDPQLLQTSYWTTITVINGSADPGATTIVSVEPNAAAVDAILTGFNTRPFTKGDINL